VAEDDNVSTTGQGKNDRDAKRKAKAKNVQGNVQKAKKTKKVIKFIVQHMGIFLPILIGLLIIIAIIGIIGFFTSLPGMYVENIKEFGKGLWGDINGFITGKNVTPTIGEDEQMELAQRIQDMGYDLVGYGFADASYEYDDNTQVDSDEVDGVTNGKIAKLNRSVDGRNYLQAYISQSEAIYVPSSWSLLGFFKYAFDNNFPGLFTGVIWNSKDQIYKSEDIKAYSEGMLNITDQSTGSPILSLLVGTPEAEDMLSVDRENKLLKIEYPRSLRTKNVYYFGMDDWSARYGKPIELFLALHLSTMMPDLAYDIATADAFNTKVNIKMQEITSTYKVIFDKDGTENTRITQEEIETLYLKIMLNMTDEEINRFKNAGVLDDAFAQLIENERQFPTWRFDLKNGDVIDIDGWTETALGADLAEAEEKLLGQKYSTFDITVKYKVEDEVHNPETDRTTTVRREVEEDRTVNKVLRCKDINDSSVQSALDNSILSGITAEQFEEFAQLILEGRKPAKTYLPRITTVDNHWYYSYVNFVYGKADRAKKKTGYIPQNDSDPLQEDKLNGGKITLDQTFEDASGAGGIFYQLCEPEVDAPNDAIVALFKGGSGTFNGISYNFLGKYYRYDGTRRTALKIANAKAIDEGKSSFVFQNETYNTVSKDNEEWKIEKQPVTFATEDEDGNKSYTDAFAAFAILENTHTQEAEYIYRNLKDLLINLRYFSKEDFIKPLTQVLLWPIESVGSDNIQGEDDSVTKGIYRKENEYGIFLKSGEAFSSGGNFIAPGDAVVQSVDGNTITIKFKSLSGNTIEELNSKFGTDYEGADANLVLDMVMTITGINPTVSQGATITRGNKIGTLTNEDVRIVLFNIDKSIVDDIQTYMYPTYKGTIEDDFINKNENTGQDDYNNGGNTTGSGSTNSTFNPDYHIKDITERQKEMYRALRDLGCTKAGACGAMGNIQLESGFNPEAKNPNSTAYGIAQWLYGSGRRQKMEEWCKSHGYQSNSYEGQLGFFLYEVQGYKSVWKKLTTSNDVIECADIFAEKYEGCTDLLGKRETYANAFMKQMAD